MANRQNAKGRSKGQSFVMVRHDMQDSNAMGGLSPVARCVWLAVNRRYNGQNNGEIPLSCREASDLANTSVNSAARAFKELQKWGFLKVGEACGFNQKGGRRSTRWTLTHHPLKGQPATNEWREFGWPKEIDGTTRKTQAELAYHQRDAKNRVHTVAYHQRDANPKSHPQSVPPERQYIESTTEGVSPAAHHTAREHARHEREHSLSKLQTIMGLGEQTRRQFQVAAIFSALVLQSQSARAA